MQPSILAIGNRDKWLPSCGKSYHYSRSRGQSGDSSFVHQVVGDAQLLYGFEKRFLNLISVSGIGPVSALAIIAADDNAGLVRSHWLRNITIDQVSQDRQKTASRWCWTWKGKVAGAPAGKAGLQMSGVGRSHGAHWLWATEAAGAQENQEICFEGTTWSYSWLSPSQLSDVGEIG